MVVAVRLHGNRLIPMCTRTYWRTTSFGALLLFAPILAFAQPDAHDIVVRSVQADDATARLARYYTYHVRQSIKLFDGKGETKSTDTETTEVLFIGGKEYEHLIDKDDKPLKPEDERKESRKLDKAVREASKLSQDELNRRYAEYEKKQAEEREQMKSVPDAFDFQLVREEVLNGRPAYVISGVPKRGYHGKHHELLSKLRGTLWIDKQDYEWVRFEAETLDTISFGLFLVRLTKGSHIEFEQTWVNDEIWMPKRGSFNGSARLALVKKFNVAGEFAFSDYHKFQTDSKIVAVSEAAGSQ